MTQVGSSGRLLSVTDAQLFDITGKSVPAGTADEINAVVPEARISSHLELAHFIGQCAYECAYFHRYEEPAVPGRYEFNLKLGNSSPGDGQRYRGRGAIQLTGRANYRSFNDWLQAKQGLEVDAPWDVVVNPDVVATAPYRWLAAAFYWQSRPQLARLAQQDDVTGVTRIITGAQTPGQAQGLWARQGLTEAAIRVLG